MYIVYEVNLLRILEQAGFRQIVYSQSVKVRGDPRSGDTQTFIDTKQFLFLLLHNTVR